MPENIKHNLAQQCFFQGQSVQPSNLNNLQTYSDISQAHLVSSVLGSGIIYGFSLSQTNNWAISISPGLAFDHNGTRLILDQIHFLDFSEYSSLKTETIYYLSIVNDFIKSDPVIDSIGDTVYTVWTPTVKFLLTASPDEHSFILASISINQSGISQITPNSTVFHTLPQTYQRTRYISSETDITNIQGDLHWNNKSIIDIMYPVGYQYTQYPDQTTFNFKAEEEPSSLFGGIWELQFNRESLFFRTEGSSSEEERDTNGIQGDTIRNITGFLTGYDLKNTSCGFGGASGAFTIDQDGIPEGRYGGVLNGPFFAPNARFNASRVVPTGSENRPINRLIRIWKRIS